MADTNKVKKKSQNIEVMRFIGILMIMNHHLYHIGYTGGGIQARSGGSGLISSLLLRGFLLIRILKIKRLEQADAREMH